MNDLIWTYITAWGWVYWTPCVLVAIRNLFLLASLDAPTTHLGRSARVFAWLAHLAMMFSPAMNSLGCVALPLMLIANNLLYEQIRASCRARAEALAHDTPLAQRVLSTIVQKP